jgi:hypothetical protein
MASPLILVSLRRHGHVPNNPVTELPVAGKQHAPGFKHFIRFPAPKD